MKKVLLILASAIALSISSCAVPDEDFVHDDATIHAIYLCTTMKDATGKELSVSFPGVINQDTGEISFLVTKDKRRLTSQGNNVDPDWGPDGRIVYTTRRAGQSQIAVITSADGDKSAQLVTDPGTWEHPTWAADGRHVVAERDGALFLIDTLEGGDEPRQLFTLSGKCITPSFFR
jgi:hypothetical protein